MGSLFPAFVGRICTHIHCCYGSVYSLSLHYSFSPCSLRISRAVDAMIKTFPPKPASPEVQISLREVHLAAKRLQAQCQESGHSDLAFHTRHIMNSAYDVAKASRHLVICAEQEQKGER